MVGDPNIDTLEDVNASAMPAIETPNKAWRCRNFAMLSDPQSNRARLAKVSRLSVPRYFWKKSIEIGFQILPVASSWRVRPP